MVPVFLIILWDGAAAAAVVLIIIIPLALQPAVGFGLSNNILPFFPICRQFSPSPHS
jgi:hypothetical protein